MDESEPPTAGLPEDQTLHLSIIFFIDCLVRKCPKNDVDSSHWIDYQAINLMVDDKSVNSCSSNKIPSR